MPQSWLSNFVESYALNLKFLNYLRLNQGLFRALFCSHTHESFDGKKCQRHSYFPSSLIFHILNDIFQVEGKGNGIKTVIANMSEIAKALNRPPTYPTKYFGCELGAQTQFDFKNERFIVNGEHDAQKLQDLLDGFIKRFVLCTECENPETSLVKDFLVFRII